MSERVHVVTDRVVITWHVDTVPRGIITGKLHAEHRGFEVDHIVRFPGTEPGDGARMCEEVWPEVVTRLGLRWILVKIADDYHREGLEQMARAFGFEPQERLKAPRGATVWRKDIA